MQAGGEFENDATLDPPKLTAYGGARDSRASALR
jgi:hypothetical protein